ncbi:hypothetical protein OF855_24705 [Mycolicibacterium fortuitum]|uniref:hypothetical protein n=1 Tax=Mycolicibacterium fortuitum TaxID=1766 RepID=UPI0022BA6020|nr:hypothetical protein [Mycolicibacterium fortuitum]WAY18441.1 hypothetical protein OF855_24705 [Mycolicibacterium fortuitum]
MTDPVIEAVHRAVTELGGVFGSSLPLEIAAREALKPIREWFDRSHGMSSITDNLLDELAPLIYSTEELS